MLSSLDRAIEIIVKVATPDQIILFGSHAKGVAKPDSDYDLLVLKSGVEHKRKLAQQIYLNFRNIGAPIDLIVADTQKYNLFKNDSYSIYSEIAKHGKVVYEKS